jgi:hypothetical protein
MDELSTHELRGTAFAANLRRAFGAPVEGDCRPTSPTLLERLSAVQPAVSRPRDRYRLGA